MIRLVKAFSMAAEWWLLTAPSYSRRDKRALGGLCYKDPNINQDFPGGSDGKAPAYKAGDPGSIPGSRRSPGEGKVLAPHSSTLAWKIPWKEEPGRLQFTGSQRVGHDWATSLLFTSLQCQSWGLHLPDIIISQGPLIITLKGLGFRHMNLGDTNIQTVAPPDTRTPD